MCVVAAVAAAAVVAAEVLVDIKAMDTDHKNSYIIGA